MAVIGRVGEQMCLCVTNGLQAILQRQKTLKTFQVFSGPYLVAHALLFYKGHSFPYSLCVLGLLISIKDKFHSKRQMRL